MASRRSARKSYTHHMQHAMKKANRKYWFERIPIVVGFSAALGWFVGMWMAAGPADFLLPLFR